MAKKLNKATWTREPAHNESEEEKRIREMEWYEKADIGLAHGVGKTYQGVKQGLYHLGDAMGMDVDTESVDQWVREEAEKRKPYEEHGGGWYTAGDIGGMTLATAPALMVPGGQATAGMRALAGAGVGGGIMATQPVEEENYAVGKSKQVGMGATLGAGLNVALPPLLEGAVNLVAKTGRGVLRVVQGKRGAEIHPEDQKLVDAWMKENGANIDHLAEETRRTFYKEVAEQLRAPKASTKAGQDAVESARRLPYKVDLTKGQITKKHEDMSLEDRMLKTDEIGEPLRQRQREQNQAMVQNLEHARERMAPQGVQEAEDIGVRYDTFTKKRLGDLQKEEVTPAYNKITEQYGDNFVELPNVMKALREMKDSGADDMSNKVRAVMKKLGDWVENSKDPRAFASTAGQGPQGRLNVRMAEQYRKKISEHAEGALPAEKNDIMTMMQALEEDVVNAVGKDVYDPARKVAQKRFSERDAYKLPASKSTADMVTKVKNLRHPELQEWASTLQKTTDGNKIFNDTRARILEDVIERSLNRSQVDALGYPLFDQRKFAGAIASFGKKRREVLFSESENQLLNDMVIVGQRRVPMRSATNPSGTGQAIWNMVLQLARSVPFSGFVGNLLKSTVGKVTSSASNAMRGQTGKAVDEALNYLKNSQKFKMGKKSDKLTRQGGIVSASELMK